MKKHFKLLAIVTALLFVFSCTSTSEIQRNMNSKSYSMAYIMDSKKNVTKNNISIKIDSVSLNSVAFNDTTIIKKEHGWFLPLVFVYIWNARYNCIQGKSMIEEDIPAFLKTSLVNEINRSGSFLVDTVNNSDYTLEISIDEIKTEGPYVSSGYFYIAFYVYGFSYGDNAGPATSDLTISYRLKKGDQVLYQNSFNSERNTEQINKRYNSSKTLQQDYAISMVEATSFNFKNSIELIVNDLNTYFARENR